MPEDQKVINVGVSFTPIVESITEAEINDVIQLKLISGLNYYDIKWECGNIVVETNSDSTVIFSKPGIYKPRVIGHLLEVSQYWITIR